MNALDNFFFIALPYVAMIVFLAGAIYRYKANSYKVSSLSSQFLESDGLFWGSVPFHQGLAIVFLIHLAAFLFPKTMLAWNAYPLRLMILEGTGFVFALSLSIGLFALLVRRITNARVRAVTTWMDIAIELLLLYQVILGCVIALNYRWGSSWFASDLSPYLWSVLMLYPHIEAIKAMPVPVKSHIACAFLIILILPFTRLMHLLVAPFHYLWRPYQQVIWNWNRKTINDPNSPWDKHEPKNT